MKNRKTEIRKGRMKRGERQDLQQNCKIRSAVNANLTYGQQP